MGAATSAPLGTAAATAPQIQLSEAQKVPNERRAPINSARGQEHKDAEEVVQSRREHPGRVRLGAATPLSKAKPKFMRPLRHGDPELKLDVDGLNGFAAMMATMKEMGYEEDEDFEEVEETQGGAQHAAASTAPDPEQGGQAATTVPGKQPQPPKPGGASAASKSSSSCGQQRLVFFALTMVVVLLAAGAVGLVFWLRSNGTLNRRL